MFKHNDGTRYYSFHHQSQRNGRGKCVYPGGSIYIGLWKNDLRHGLAKFTNYPRFDYYGYWIDGKIDYSKAGVLVTPDEVVKGVFINGYCG